MPTSLEHGPKCMCRKANKGHHTLEMRTNGTWHETPNITHLREKERRKEGVLKSIKPKGKAKLLNLMHTATWLNHMLTSVPFFLVPGRLCPSSKLPCSMYVHSKAKTRNQQTSNGRKRCKQNMKRHKANKHDRHGKQRSQKTSKKANKQESKQKVMSVRNKCRFGLDVHSFIVLKHGRHTSKQGSCMDM